MHVDVQVRYGHFGRFAESSVLFIDILDELPDEFGSLLVSRLIQSTHAEHEWIRALLLFRTLQEARALASKAQFCSRLFCNGLHVLPVRAKQLACYLELGLFVNTDEELALGLSSSVSGQSLRLTEECSFATGVQPASLLPMPAVPPALCL